MVGPGTEGPFISKATVKEKNAVILEHFEMPATQL